MSITYSCWKLSISYGIYATGRHQRCQNPCRMPAHRIGRANDRNCSSGVSASAAHWRDRVSYYCSQKPEIVEFILDLCHFLVHGTEINKSYLEKNKSDLSIGDISTWFQGRTSAPLINSTQEKKVTAVKWCNNLLELFST